MAVTRTRVRWDFVAQVGILTILFSYLFFSNSNNYDFMDANQALVGITLMTLLGLAWLLRGRRASTTLGLSLAIYSVIFTLASAFSIDPRRSFGEGVYLLAAIFIFLISAEMAVSGIPWTRVLLAFAISGGIYMAFLWLPAVFWYRDWLAANPGHWLPSISFRLPTPTNNSYFVNVLLFVGFIGLIRVRSWVGRIVTGFFILSALLLLFLGSTRSAWLGAGAGILLAGFLFVRQYRAWFFSAWQAVRRRRWLLAIFIAAALFLAGAGGYVLYRQAFHPTHGSILDSRQPFWGPALQAFSAHPILGTGPATYPAAYLAAWSVPPVEFFPHAHSVPFNILAEMGILGLLAFLLVFAAAWRRLFSRLKLSDPDARPLMWAAAGLLLCFSVQGIFDTFQIDPNGLWAMLIVLGVALSSPLASAKRQPTVSRVLARRFLARPWWLLLLFAASWAGYLVFQPFYQGVQAANRSDWTAAAASFQRSAILDPRHAIDQQQLGLAESILASRGDPAALDLAIRAFESAVRLDPAFTVNHLNLGALYLHRAAPGDLQLAVAEFQAATQKAPLDSVAWLNLGLAYETSGQTAEALQAYAKALSLDSAGAAAFFWRSTPLRLQAAAAWRQENPPAVAPALADLETRAAADSATGANWLRLTAAYLLAGRLPDASHALSMAGLAYLSPYGDPLEQDWLETELAAANGDLALAARSGQAVIDRYLFQGAFGPGTSGSLTKYVQRTFRRPVMALEYVPWVQTIPLPDAWGKRMLELAGWQAASGNEPQAGAVRSQLLQLIPDADQALAAGR